MDRLSDKEEAEKAKQKLKEYYMKIIKKVDHMYHMLSLPIPKICLWSSDVIITKSNIFLFFIIATFPAICLHDGDAATQISSLPWQEYSY